MSIWKESEMRMYGSEDGRVKVIHRGAHRTIAFWLEAEEVARLVEEAERESMEMLGEVLRKEAERYAAMHS